jgi:DNA-binding SARP family transcriptional activator
MPDFLLSLLGPPTLATSQGGPVTPQPGAKAMALLAYLQLERRPQSREALASLLWGESPEVEARASLRQAVKHLRDTLGEAVRADRTLVQLAAPLGCDVTDFRALLDESPVQAAAFEIPRFLEGVSIRRAPLFDEWVSSTRSLLLRQYHDALARAAREAMGQTRWREAMDLAERWLASDPLADEAAQLTVEARYLAGQRGAALSRYAEYRDLLLKETGREPSRALEALVRRVESDRAAHEVPPASTDEWFVHAPTFDSSLVGRDAQWKTLASAWKRSKRGQAQIVLIEGESGVGKSRLTDEFLRWVLADGGTVLRGRSHDRRTGMPYEPVVEVLRHALAAPGLAGTAPEWLAEVARIVPEMHERFPALVPITPEPGESWRLFEGIAQLLSALAGERPVAIAIDDLQWCDEDCAQLLRFLTRRLEHAPMLWIGLLTPGEVERDAPVARLCRVLRAKSHADVVTLGPLSEEGVLQLLREMGHLSAPNGGLRFAARLFRITAGNPFYLIELLKTMFAQGLLVREEGTGEWMFAPDAVGAGREVPVPRTVQDAIAERVDGLADELRDVLVTLAVGGSCRPEVLSHVHGISRLHAAALGDALVDRHLAAEDQGAYGCIHPVIAHMVRDGLTASRRRETHRALALALEVALSAEELGEVAGQVARHADRGGERPLAYRYALLAAQAAAARYAYSEALSWLDLAAASARSPTESEGVDALTAEVLERAGLSEAPRPSGPLPVTREIMSEDLDLRVRR